MLDIRQIHPLTDFLRNHKKHITRITKMKSPAILTVNGKAVLIVQDAESYQLLVELAERARYIEAIRQGLESAGRGEDKQPEQIFDEMVSKSEQGLEKARQVQDNDSEE